MRLDKYLAEASIGMRKEVREYIHENKITVNGCVIIEPAYDIDESKDYIEYLGEKVIHNGRFYYMFHKPAGCVTARKDVDYKTVIDYFPNANTYGLFPVGRLDMDTEGLLFITNDGDFDHKLMEPTKHVDKTYFFWAFGTLGKEEITQIELGIGIYEDDSLTKPAKIKVLEQGKFDVLRSSMEIEEFHYKKKNTYNQSVVSGHLTISEGKKHQVKRMLKAVGCYVVYLKRISIGEVSLDENLLKGEYRKLHTHEIKLLMGE